MITKRFKIETLYDDTDYVETKYGTIEDIGIDTDYETDCDEEKSILSKLKNFIENCDVKDSYTWIVNPTDAEQSKLTRIK